MKPQSKIDIISADKVVQNPRIKSTPEKTSRYGVKTPIIIASGLGIKAIVSITFRKASMFSNFNNPAKTKYDPRATRRNNGPNAASPIGSFIFIVHSVLVKQD
jgi:hypothetical protein